MDAMNDVYIQNLEEDDKPKEEMNSTEEATSQARIEVLSDYQKKMRDERARRFGVDRKTTEP